ncbi:unnamed protein product [Bursaphelenchus xylophilus]|uniref:(pine wood nematode) hypothetical protein n=1 Tax=Bursaphelenchus xylophilus TaxID=6326 RepID=A0A1I7RWW2_BURXY|nr:unnamed protein product [Bursaphelenchus xylophilus]CAG9121155.1 unnamed protein product [Bursaphelenchus xylophilus]
MSKLVCLALLVSAASALPSNATFGAAPAAFGVDSTYPLTDSIASCLKRSGYFAGFFRVGNKATVDSTGVDNAYKANRAGLKFELFITPNPQGYADRQLYDAYDYAKKNNINLARIWLQITSPISWDRSQSNNVRFINDFVRAGRNRNVKVSFYTNWYDYEEITGNSRAIANAEIWYWHVLGAGSNGETARDYNDYRTFGPFTGWPIAKQYGVAETPCNYRANQNVFAGSGVTVAGAEDIIPIGMGASIVQIQDNKTKQ